MKVFVVLSMVVLSGVLAASDETCSNDIVGVCKSSGSGVLPHCTAKYAGALMAGEQPVLEKLQKFAVDQLKQSFEFMLRASYFGNYKASRAGFSKLFRSLSDEAWTDAISVIQLVAQRGGDSVFKDKPVIGWDQSTVEVDELQSLGRALDTVKRLATEANGIHHRATHRDPTDTGAHHDHHDAHIAHYVQEEFSGKYAKSVRTLAGYSSDLKQLLLGLPDDLEGTGPTKREKSLSLYLFDEYLLKQ